MNPQSFTTLEFEKLRALVRRSAQTELGRMCVDRILPIENRDALSLALAATEEMVGLRERGISWSFAELNDPTDAVAFLGVEGATLDPMSLLDVVRLCERALSVRSVLIAEREQCTELWNLLAGLPRELHSVVARVTSKILPGGELDDRASPELARIRSEINRMRSQITRALERLMGRSEESIQDVLVTVRNDRFVVPVKSDHRGRVPGVAHGFSSSGVTTFIEPLETIESNNELQALREAEQREIHKILRGLTDELRRERASVEIAIEAVTELDFIGAKAAFFRDFKCTIPEITSAGEFELIEARHPLLEENLRASGGAVVPVSLRLNPSESVMVISGANAGGKTVVLKTAGLLALMARCGLPVPAREARVPFYLSILADIGDHQSLAANLSTFTSHVSNIASMIELCESPALVLLDEVGTGTDPEEGSALGVAVVDFFKQIRKAQVIATTHYGGLKMYASNGPGVVNASVEFDEKTLKPTYRLLVGLAGASSGLEIARRFGMRDEIIEAANLHVSSSSRDAAEFLRRVKREAEEAAFLRLALEEEREAVAEKFAALDLDARRRERERHAEFERDVARAVADFEKQASALVTQVKDKMERAKLDRELGRAKSAIRREATRAVQSVHARENAGPLRVVARDSGNEQQESAEIGSARQLKVGDHVRLRAFGSVGVVERIDGDDAEVRVKSLRFREKAENLDLVQSAAPEAQRERFARQRVSHGTEVKLTESSREMSSELNLIGQNTDEAVETVDKFLDEAFLNSLHSVRIIHGHGTGALRRAIATLLSDHPHVERFRSAPPEQGGTGATLVELRQ